MQIPFPIDFFVYLILLAILTVPLGWSCLRFLGWFSPYPSAYIPMALVLGLVILLSMLFVVGHIFPLCLYTAAGCSLMCIGFFVWKGTPSSLPWNVAFASLMRHKMMCVCSLVVLLCYLGLHYYQPGHAPWFYNLMSDYIKHDGVIWSITDQTLPPINPFSS